MNTQENPLSERTDSPASPAGPQFQTVYHTWSDASEAGNPAEMRRATEQMIGALEPLIGSKARLQVFLFPGADVGELTQAGRLAIAPAMQRYDPNRGVSFLAYILAVIEGAIVSSACASVEKKPPVEAQGVIPRELVDWEPAVDRRIVLQQALDQLPEREARILRMRYLDGMTLAEVAAEEGCSDENIRQIGARALGKMRDTLGPSGLELLG